MAPAANMPNNLFDVMFFLRFAGVLPSTATV